MDTTASPLFAVTERLRQAQERGRRQLIVDAALGAVAVALAVFVVVEGGRQAAAALGFAQGWAGSLAGSAGVAAGVLLAGLLAGVFWVRARTPQEGALARRADLAFGLDDRIATALDAERRSGPDGPSGVVAALLHDAAGRAGLVDPAVLARFRLPVVAYALPVLVLAAVALVIIAPSGEPPAPSASAPMSEAQSEALTEAERAEAVTDIRQLSELIAQQAETRSDAYMEAVARTLQSLGDRLEADETVLRSEIAADIGELARHAETAGTEWRGTMGERIPNLLNALAEDIAAPPAPAQPRDEAAGPPEGAAPGGPEASGGLPDSPRTERDFDSLMQEFADANFNAVPPGSEGAAQQANVSGDFYSAALEQNRLRREQAALNPQAAQLIGPSSNAQAGESLLAGDGTQELGDEALGPVAVTFESSAQLMLETNEIGEGRRFEMEVPPTARLSDIVALSPEDAAGGWVRSPVAEADRPYVGFADRTLVSTYLQALAGQSGR